MSAVRRNLLACPECGTQWHGNRDVCPFCHAHIHGIGGHRCRECRTYIPTVEQLRDVERAMRGAAIAPDAAETVRAALLRTLPASLNRLAYIARHAAH